MKKFNLLHKTAFLFLSLFIFSFIPKEETKIQPIGDKVIKIDSAVEQYYLNVQYDPGLTEAQKQAVRNCMTNTYGIQFITHIPDFIAIGGDVELWLVQADISVIPGDKDGSGSNWGNGDGSEDGDQLPKGRICNALVTFSRVD